MLEIAGLTVSKVGMLLAFIATGYLLRRSGKLPENAGKVLSTLCATIFCPAYTMRNIWNNFTISKIMENALVMGYGLLFTLISIFFALLLARIFGKPGMERKSLAYAFAIPNYGYFGYPVVEGVFGSAFLAQVLVFVVPLSIATNTYGYLLFTPTGKLNWKRVLNPLMIGVLLGMILGIAGVPMVPFVDDILTNAGNCMSPLAMLLAGFVLGSFPVGKLVSSLRAYLMSIVRLVGIPLVFGAVLWVCGLRGQWLLLPLVVYAMPLGLNLVVYPESQGMDASDNARMCCVSYILAVVILPLVFGVLTLLA